MYAVACMGPQNESDGLRDLFHQALSFIAAGDSVMLMS